MSQITFNDLPEAVRKLQESVDHLLNLFLESKGEPPKEVDEWFDIKGLCAYLPDKPKKSTVYAWVHDRYVPYHKVPGTKKLKFLKSEIDAWIKKGRKKTFTESSIEADARFQKKGGPHGY